MEGKVINHIKQQSSLVSLGKSCPKTAKSCSRPVLTANYGKAARAFQWLCEKQHWETRDIRKGQQHCESEQQKKGCEVSSGSHLYNPGHLKMRHHRSGEEKQSTFSPAFHKSPAARSLHAQEKSICLSSVLPWWFWVDGDISWRAHLGKGSAGPQPAGKALSALDIPALIWLPALHTHPLLKTCRKTLFTSRLRWGLGIKHHFHSWWGSFWAKGKDDPGQRRKFPC